MGRDTQWSSHPIAWPLQGWKPHNKVIVQMPLKHWQTWVVEHVGSLVQCLNMLSVKKCLLMPSLNLPWCSIEPFLCLLSLDPKEKRSTPPSPLLLRKLWREMKWSLSLLFSKLDKPRVLSHPSQKAIVLLSFFEHIWEPSHPFIDCAAQHCTQDSGHTSAEYSRIIPSPDHLVQQCLVPSRMQFALLVAQAHCWFSVSLLPTAFPDPHFRTDLQPLFSWLILVSRVTPS